MRPSPYSAEDVRRLRSHARDTRDPSDDDRRHRYTVAVAIVTALRLRLDRAGPVHRPSNPRVGTRPSGSASLHKITVLGTTFFFEHIEPLVIDRLEERRPASARSREALAFARALRYTCGACSRQPNAYVHSACVHLPTVDVLACRDHAYGLWLDMQPYALPVDGR